MNLAGKVAVITGSTSGIGLAIAKRLGLDGAKIVVSSRKSANVDKAVETLLSNGIKEVTGTICHVAKEADRSGLIDFAVDKFGTVDILVNNAGISPVYGSLLDVNEAAWDKLFDTNVKSGFMLSKKVIPLMQKQGSGNIIFVSSVTGYTPFPGIGAYSISKTAVLSLVKALAMECGPHKIRVNGIAPGIVKTEFSKAIWNEPEARKFYENMTPLGRFAQPDDCAGAVSFLCSDLASYITGETILITGGIVARL